MQIMIEMDGDDWNLCAHRAGWLRDDSDLSARRAGLLSKLMQWWVRLHCKHSIGGFEHLQHLDIILAWELVYQMSLKYCDPGWRTDTRYIKTKWPMIAHVLIYVPRYSPMHVQTKSDCCPRGALKGTFRKTIVRFHLLRKARQNGWWTE